MLEVVRFNKQEKPIKESKVSVTFCPDGLTTPKKFKLRLWLNKTKMTTMMSTLIRKPSLQKVCHFFLKIMYQFVLNLVLASKKDKQNQYPQLFKC